MNSAVPLLYFQADYRFRSKDFSVFIRSMFSDVIHFFVQPFNLKSEFFRDVILTSVHFLCLLSKPYTNVVSLSNNSLTILLFTVIDLSLDITSLLPIDL